MTRCSIATLGGNAFNQIDVRFLELLDELPRIGRHAVEKTALPFREQDVERDASIFPNRSAGDDDHLVARNIERDVLEIVLARAVDADGAVAISARNRGAVFRRSRNSDRCHPERAAK